MRRIITAIVVAVIAAASGLIAGCETGGGGPEGEVWEWALGRNVWEDPDLARYGEGLGREWTTDVDVQSEGFKLGCDSTGVVTSVSIFNDEAALGYPGTQHYSAYAGELPAGLSWDSTASDLGAQYGATNQSGGYGSDIVFAYRSEDGYLYEVAFVARDQGDLPGSPIHSITVRRT